jgi:Tfp pilus assembly protein PilF
MKLKLITSLLAVLTFIACKNSTKKQASDASTLPPELQAMNDSILKDNRNADLYHRRAIYYLNHKNIKDAADNMKVVMMLDSSKAKYYVTMGDVYFVQNNTRDTRDYLLRGLTKEGSKLEVNTKLAELYFYVKQYDDAIKFINNSLREDVHYAKAYFLKGMIYKESGDTTKAVSSFITATEQDPEYYNAYMQLGIIYALKNNPICLDYYNNALRINPKSDEVHYNIGMFFMENKKYNKAIERFTLLGKINPRNREAFFNLGYIHLNFLDVKAEALKNFTDAINADNNYEKAYYMRGYTFELMGDVAAAKRDYTKALALYPDYEMAQKGMERVTK